VLGLAHFGMEQFDKAATLFERAHKRYATLLGTVVVSTYGHLGRKQESSADHSYNHRCGTLTAQETDQGHRQNSGWISEVLGAMRDLEISQILEAYTGPLKGSSSSSPAGSMWVCL